MVDLGEGSIDDKLQENPLTVASQRNLKVFPRQNDVTGFYGQSSIVLNLSDKNRVIETFGLTALEPIHAALPVILPTEGGVAEMVDDGVNGYKIDVQNRDLIAQRIEEILSQEDLYIWMADNALKHALEYDTEEMLEKMVRVMENEQ